MYGWRLPPQREPSKGKEQLEQERRDKVEWLAAQGLLQSERIRQALLRVPREEFIPALYRDYAYEEVPLPLPGTAATISCPHSYPLFYEPLGLDQGHRFLEVGLGSGYGTALAREVVGAEGLVVGMEIDPLTFEYAASNLDRAGYRDVVLVQGDGGLGYPELQPYDRIAVTAACPEIPPPLIEQLAANGRLIAPILESGVQSLIVLEKRPDRLVRRPVCEVLYVSLRGRYGMAPSQNG